MHWKSVGPSCWHYSHTPAVDICVLPLAFVALHLFVFHLCSFFFLCSTRLQHLLQTVQTSFSINHHNGNLYSLAIAFNIHSIHPYMKYVVCTNIFIFIASTAHIYQNTNEIYCAQYTDWCIGCATVYSASSSSVFVGSLMSAQLPSAKYIVCGVYRSSISGLQVLKMKLHIKFTRKNRSRKIVHCLSCVSFFSTYAFFWNEMSSKKMFVSIKTVPISWSEKACVDEDIDRRGKGFKHSIPSTADFVAIKQWTASIQWILLHGRLMRFQVEIGSQWH